MRSPSEKKNSLTLDGDIFGPGAANRDGVTSITMRLFAACTRSFTHWPTSLASPVATHKFYDSLSAAHPPSDRSTDRRESCNRQLQQNCQLNWKRGRDRLGVCASVAVRCRVAVMGRHLQRLATVCTVVRLRHWIHTSKHARSRAGGWTDGLFGVRVRRSSRSVGRTATACASFGRFGPFLLLLPPPSMLNPSSTGDGGTAAVHDGGDVACKH